jgi:hypothetical protein
MHNPPPPATSQDLLDALRALTYAVERFTNAQVEDWPEIATARAVIAQATGEGMSA